MTYEKQNTEHADEVSTGEGLVNLNVWIPDATYQRAKSGAAQLGISLAMFIAVALDAFDAKSEVEQVADMLVTAGVLVREVGGR